MNITQDYYAILGVPHVADTEDIKAAYRRSARRLHPDRNKHPGAKKQFADIAKAFEVLGNPSARYEYDLRLKRDGLAPPYYSMRVTPSKRIVKTLPEAQVIYVLLEVLPDPALARSVRNEVPLNLVLVIDRSTSMKGARLDRVKQAAHRIVDALGPDDTLSIVSFSDRAEVVFEATKVSEKSTLKAMVSTMQASGGTEILQGLQMGANELRKNLSAGVVNHLILLTDGQTYGDEDDCLALAGELSRDGIGISTIGIGQEWNDVFLDELASKTGGSSTYINAPSAVVRFLNEKVRSLGSTFAERLVLSVAPDSDVSLEYAFKLMPHPQPLPTDKQSIPLGSMEKDAPISVILQLQLPALEEESFRTIIRLDVTGDILTNGCRGFKSISDLSIEVAANAPQEPPPAAIMDALGKLTLYRMQEKAQQAIAQGQIQSATRMLENLATRLLESGQEGLAHAAVAEARRVARTTMLSEEGQKTLKYGTRALVSPESAED